MPYNPSLANFKKEMKTVKAQLRQNFHATMLLTAREIADNMEAAAPKDKGILAGTVRIQDNSRIAQASSRISVKIKAGGPDTRRRSAKSGEVYDYSAAVEFGTHDMQPEPFFYNTWRRYRSQWPNAAAETLEQTIERNQKIVSQRAGDAGRNTLGRHQGVIVGKQGK